MEGGDEIGEVDQKEETFTYKIIKSSGCSIMYSMASIVNNSVFTFESC